MVTTSTPVWSAPHNGIIGDASATAGTGHVDQFLGTHADQVIYQGSSILTPLGAGGSSWGAQLATQDVDQPFTMSGTSIGRVQVPLLPVGQGADLLVSLCADSTGIPGSVITQTRIPAAWIAQLAAASGLNSAGPLATAAGNALLYGNWQSVSWSPPATSATGGLSTAQLAQSGNYFIFAGGVNAANGNSSATVAVITWTGGDTVSSSAPGPSLPQPLLSGGLAVTNDSLCYAGGVNASGTTFIVQSTVYLASWDPATGTIGSWSVQAALPATLVNPGIAAYLPTDTVYIVGGSQNYAGETAMVSTVYYATIVSGQITAWTSAPPIPVPVADPTVAVIGNWLICAGGYNSSGNGTTGVYYAPINPTTGVPGAWVSAPPVPAGLYVEGATAVTTNAIVWPQTLSLATDLVAQDTLTLTWDDHGPGSWVHQIGPIAVLNQDQVTAMVPTSGGAYQIFNFQDSAYITANVLSVPTISVPLSASGLSSGTTYHVVLQQQGGNAGNYLMTSTSIDLFPGNPTLLTSNRGAYSWSTASPSGTAVSMQIFDNAPPGDSSGMPVHLWEDSGSKITTLVPATTPDQSLLGILEATRQSYALNANAGFESSLTPWTVSGGTFAQSTTEVYTGQYSCQITPSGSSAQVGLSSETLACMPGQAVTATGWVWFTAAVTANASISVNWFTLGGAYITTSYNEVSVPAAAWTELTNSFIAPATAYSFTINPTLGGTPAASQVWYLDTCHAHYTYTGPQNSTVTMVNWPGTGWPTEGNPLGTTVLA